MNRVISVIICAWTVSMTSTLYAQTQGEEAIRFELNGKPLNGNIQRYNEYNIIADDVTYNNGYRKGLYKTYYTNGILFSQVNYIDGKREGELKTFYENGKTREVYLYQHGLLEGVSRSFDKKGKIEREQLYANGVIVSETDIDTNGNIKSIRTFTNGQIATREFFNKKGKLEKKTLYVDSEPYKIAYYRNGYFDYDTKVDYPYIENNKLNQ